ncbi:eukaryotic translation initiation factor 4 gamma 1 isoform X4 [Harpegnathos saltator]|uniref:eukaryotic translation initiation factor 4 gamma 1 isoform X4 n=1 Tax=Harpegnathos saltator TaxID=610380 RepID=UPI000DBEEB13|nr:eukaryotic translation initiation factor 4 gamma 1 isoform X4 [Harpegnathos saltator]
MPAMSMPTKGKHHHLSHHHQQHHSQQQQHQQQGHHNPSQHQHQLILNVNQPVVPHPPQTYSAVVTTNTPRFLPNAVSHQSKYRKNYNNGSNPPSRMARYGVSKDSPVGVAVGVGPIGVGHSILPQCNTSHHHQHHHIAATHPPNAQPGHNHHSVHHPVHHQQQQPPLPSPGGPHHPLALNLNQIQHHQQQQQQAQTQHQQLQPQFRVITANARSDFHVPGQNYGAQPGGQVGAGGGSVGVPGGRGPPLGGIQTIGQSAAGIPPGGPAGAQAPSQAPAPGVQAQPPQGPAPTTTPPVHTQPQEMGKQAHLQTQPPSLPQVYVQTQTRPTNQGYYPGPRPQQQRGLNHRGGQGASGTPVVGMASVGGGGGQPTAIYPHPASLTVQAGAMYVQSQVPGLHTPHQQSVYPMNNQLPLQFPPPQRHQAHQNQSYYQFQHAPLLTPPNVFGYAHAPSHQPTGYYYSPSNTMSLTRASAASAVSGGAQHVAGPLAGAQGAPVVPQGTLQQPTQQTQTLPPMGIPLTQTDVYAAHNGGPTNATNSTTRSRKPRGQNAILDIVNPLTGKNISDEIYKDNETTQSGESSNRETPQPQNNGAEVIADFAARVAKAATEESDSGSTVSASASDTTANTAQTATAQSLSNVQNNSSNGANSQYNTNSSSATQNVAGGVVSAINSQSLGTSNKAQVDSTVAKMESKPLQLPVKEFQPRSEIKNTTIEESSAVVPAVVAVASKDTVPVSTANTGTVTATAAATTATIATTAAETQPEAVGSGPGPIMSSEVAKSSANASPNVTQTAVTTSHWSVPPNLNIGQDIAKPSATAPGANPVPAREPFPNLSAKNTSNSPPRRKSQNHAHSQPNATELPSSAKEQKGDRKTREKSLSSRGGAASSTPVHNQQADHHHQKANGDAVGQKAETENLPRNEAQQQKPVDSKAMQKQKSKNKLKPRELNRKGAEKEGTDMDAFVNAAPATPKVAEIKQDNKESQSVPVPPKDSNKESVREIKDMKEKDNYESKKEKEILAVSKNEKHELVEVSKESSPVQQAPSPPVVDKLPSNKETLSKESSPPKIGDIAKPPSNVCNMQPPKAAVPAAIVTTTTTTTTTTTVPVVPVVPVVPAVPVVPVVSVVPVVPVVVVPNDVVDHAKIKEDINLEILVAQKNEENSKVSAMCTSNEEEEKPTVASAEGAKQDVEMKDASTETMPKAPVLKYTYKEDQWSPINTAGKKMYDRDFLMRLQFDPNSKIKPPNLPDLEIVLKDPRVRLNAITDLKPFAQVHMNRHDALMPGFAKANVNRLPPTNRKSHPGKPSKAAKPNVIQYSLSVKEDVQLKRINNAWVPLRVQTASMSEEDMKTFNIVNGVRGVLNKLTPEKFGRLMELIKELEIDTPSRLQDVISLVFEKAVDEPCYSVEYAQLCKELGPLEVKDPEMEGAVITFKKLIITRCQKEFEKNPNDDIMRNKALKEIEECRDSNLKKEMKLMFEDKERRQRVKAVGNVRFIGELYRATILTTKIMHRCIKQLLQQNSEESMECLCKLFETIGPDIEAVKTGESINEYFNRMQEIVCRRGQNLPKINSRVRFMIQDVIELRERGWKKRRDEENSPKTIEEITKEAESEKLDSQLNNALFNTPRKDDRNNDKKRNRLGPTDDGWSQPVGRMRLTAYSVETAKLKNKPPPMDDMQLGSRNAYLWAKNPVMGGANKTISANKFACLENMSNFDQDKRMPLPLSGSRSTGPCGRDYKSSYDGRNSRNGSHQMSGASSSRGGNSLLDSSRSQSMSMPSPMMKSVSQSGTISHKPPMSEQDFTKALDSTLRHYLAEQVIEDTTLEVKEKFDSTTLSKFTLECINHVFEKTAGDRECVSKLMSHLIKENILPLQCFKSGLGEVLQIIDELVIDLPKIWTYLAEILSHSIEEEAVPLSEMKSVFLSLKTNGFVGKLFGELMMKVSQNKGPKWVADKWDQSGLQLSNLLDPELEDADKIIKDYNLEFLTGDCNSAKSSTITNSNQPNLVQIQENLRRLMKENTSFDEICSWINENVHTRVKDPKFIRSLMTAILETSVEPIHDTWRLNQDIFISLQTLIQRYVDADEMLELQCLYAIQSYMTKLEYPSGLLITIINRLWMDNVISSDAFLTWHNAKDPAEREGHAVAMVALTSFFTDLQEPDDNSSIEELSPKADRGCC